MENNLASTPDIAVALEKILDVVSAKKPAYMTIGDIAEDLQISLSAATRVTSDPAFPRAVRLPNGRGGTLHPRWSRQAVTKYIMRAVK